MITSLLPWVSSGLSACLRLRVCVYVYRSVCRSVGLCPSAANGQSGLIPAGQLCPVMALILALALVLVEPEPLTNRFDVGWLV
jgi:hypothetical protein